MAENNASAFVLRYLNESLICKKKNVFIFKESC